MVIALTRILSVCLFLALLGCQKPSSAPTFESNIASEFGTPRKRIPGVVGFAIEPGYVDFVLKKDSIRVIGRNDPMDPSKVAVTGNPPSAASLVLVNLPQELWDLLARATGESVQLEGAVVLKRFQATDEGVFDVEVDLDGDSVHPYFVVLVEDTQRPGFASLPSEGQAVQLAHRRFAQNGNESNETFDSKDSKSSRSETVAVNSDSEPDPNENSDQGSDSEDPLELSPSAKAPVLDLSDAEGISRDMVFRRSGDSVFLGQELTVVDEDSLYLGRAQVRLVNAPNGTQEKLQVDEVALGETRIVQRFEPTTHLLSLKGVDTVENYQKVLRTIKYVNESTHPEVWPRRVIFTASDGTNNSVASEGRVVFTGIQNDPRGGAGTIVVATARPEGSHIRIGGTATAGFYIIDGSEMLNFAAGQELLVIGSDLADHIVVDATSTQSVTVYAGGGDDVVEGGRGYDLILGEGGNDALYGREGRDILIGGSGEDILYGLYPGMGAGGEDQDLLIGGATAYDGNRELLRRVYIEWHRNDPYHLRVQKLLVGPSFDTLISPSAHFDTERDTFSGGPDRDFFLTNMGDIVRDLSSGLETTSQNPH